MRRPATRHIFCISGVVLAGCAGSQTLTPNQKAAATHQWNSARAGALTSLANDQYKEGNFEKCQETLGQALRLEPDNAGLHVLAARLAIEQGKLEAAERHLTDARRLEPKNAEPDYLSGVLLQRWQQPERACEAYALACTKNPSELSYLLAYAETLVTLGKPREAIGLLQSKANSFEHSGVIHDEIGQLLVGQKRYAEAVDELRKASVLSSNDPSVREHLAFALFAAKRYSEAADVFDRVLRDAGYEKRADVRAAMGECQAQTHRLVDAQTYYDAATKLNPSACGYWLGLAKVTTQLGDLPRAELAVRKAISLNGTSSEAQCLLGYVRLKQEQLPQSLAAFRAAADLDAKDSVSVCMQGYLLARMGRHDDAKAFYAKALAMNPHDVLANRLAQVDLAN